MLSVIRRVVVICVTFVAGAVFASFVAYAWNGPPCMDPDDCNVAAPVNVGTVEQRKDGILGVNGLAVFGNAIISGVSRYLNFGTSVGESGFGFRDNAGKMEFKDSGGEWQAFGTGDGSSSIEIPTCPTGQVLTGTDGGLSCVASGAAPATGSWCGTRIVHCGRHRPTGSPTPYSQTPITAEYMPSPSIPCNGTPITATCGTFGAGYGDEPADPHDLAGVSPNRFYGVTKGSNVSCPAGYAGLVFYRGGVASFAGSESAGDYFGIYNTSSYVTCVKN